MLVLAWNASCLCITVNIVSGFLACKFKLFVSYRIISDCRIPAVWHLSLRCTKNCYPSILKFIIIILLLLSSTIIIYHETRKIDEDTSYAKYVKKYEQYGATDTNDPNLYFGIVLDAGSSGTRVFVYFWPPHDGKHNKLLQIQQMRDKYRNPVVKKIKPGLSTFKNNPEDSSEYIKPLLEFAASHIPKKKHVETQLYILATAGMRMLPESQQKAILDDLQRDVPKDFDFLFSDTHFEVISGKQEGVYAWIGINYVLGRFDHADDDDPIVDVEMPAEEEAKSLLAEFSLGCDAHHMEHKYRVYVTTFLGFGGNAARSRYEDMLIKSMLLSNRSSLTSLGLSPVSPILDPCLPTEMQSTINYRDKIYHLQGTGDFTTCHQVIQPLLNKTVPCQKQPCSVNGIFQPDINFANSEFYGFSEYWYCMEDVLRIGGPYSYERYHKAAADFCATRWSLIEEHRKKGLYTKADEHRLKYQCFKSAWMMAVLHNGFKFPKDYKYFRTASLIHDKEVQWTLGAILHRTRYLPLREIQQGSFQKNYQPPWIPVSVVSYEYLLILCFIIVLTAILLFLRRLRGMTRGRVTLKRVPTMAYYMTEEGQQQDGIHEEYFNEP
ncbi:ectonucleoside triphosphate diphosphohydrolase 4-like [Anneissia japonica]|uniref:ectonucleoside triphosphate diphosphohydrolase 4-like n=1 Tax=Anneissia japonica TaxID=1529436 RepID=UPI001425B57A|nr:ectonucleoside triphosphate diphosphohydrolase 4-like [Anneissia japonica]